MEKKNEHFKELLDTLTDEQIKVLKNIVKEKYSDINGLSKNWEIENAEENDEHNIMQIDSVIVDVLKKIYGVKIDENPILKLEDKARELTH